MRRFSLSASGHSYGLFDSAEDANRGGEASGSAPKTPGPFAWPALADATALERSA